MLLFVHFLQMTSSSRYLSEKELEEIVRQYEAEETDAENDLMESEASESDDHESEDEIVADEITAESESSDSDDQPLETLRHKVLYGKNGHKWYYEPFHPRNSRTSRSNIVLHLPGPKQNARGKRTKLETWELFFDEAMLDLVVVHTNEEICRNATNFQNQRYISETNKTEILALFGLLYLRGVLKENHTDIEELWSKKYGPPIFRATMTKNRFSFLIRCLRFDDKNTRVERKKKDKFAAVRNLWEKFVENCRKNYTPSEYVTVDEQLLSFRGRCPFKMYIPNKPDKYGIKIVMLCDAKTFYMLNAIPYIGKEERTSNLPIPTQYVLKLTEPIQDTNRNVTMDNWFTSVPLAVELLKHGLTMVGTLRKNKPEIPPEFLKKNKDNFPSTMFGFDNTKTIVSHFPKKNRIVLFLSTMHKDKAIEENSQKPEVNLLYNATKGGVDTFDQLCHSKSVAGKTRRWPLRVVYGILDSVAINAFVIYKANNCNNTEPRKKFLKDLGEKLTEGQLRKRLEVKNLPHTLRLSIMEIVGLEPETTVQQPSATSSNKRCAICPRARDRKGRNNCIKCQRPLCAEHSLNICQYCN